MSFEIFEEIGYDLDLDLLIILYSLRVSYPRRGGLAGKNNHLRPIYLSILISALDNVHHMKALILFVCPVLLMVAEHEVIPGRPIPAECHAEAHTDYDGLAVRWGLTHHVASAADCCQACLDQAKDAKDGEKKCNIWVYCAKEDGCYSPDKYEHKNHECWLKQVS